MIHFELHDPFSSKVDTSRLKNVITHALAANEKQAATVELTLVVTDDAEIRELNQQYLGVDAPTDVLSFPSDEFDPDSNLQYIGDIILSFPRAEEQALKNEHPVEAEIELLVVHAVLHLLGFDHAEPDEKHAMWQKQKQILDELGTPLKVFPE